MSWISLARREASVNAKKVGTWAICLLMVFFVVTAYRTVSDTETGAIGADAIVLTLQLALANGLLIGGLLLGHRAVLDERISGSIKLTAAMPHSRRDIIVGKTVGLVAPFAVFVVVLSLVMAVVATATVGIPSPLRLVAFTTVSLGYLALCIGLGVAISATMTASGRASIAMLFSLVVILLWKQLVTSAYTAVTKSSLDASSADALLFFLRRLDPRGAYLVVTNWIYDVGNAPATYGSVIRQLQENTFVSGILVVESAFESTPVYLAEPVGVLVLALWGVVPLAAATRAFEKAHLP